MTTLNPTKATELADEIYSVQKDNEYNRFLSNPIFKQATKTAAPSHKHLKAEVGGRIILNHEDGFGICAEVSENRGSDVFFIQQ